MPVSDQLAECLLLPAMFRPATYDQVVTACGTNTCGTWDAGAIPAASTSYVITILIVKTYVCQGRG